MNVFLTILMVLALSYLLSVFARKIKLPVIVALISVGLLLDSPGLKANIVEPNKQLIFLLGDIGLLVLMFMAGMQSSWRTLYAEKKDAFLITLFSALVPFFLGFFVFYAGGYPPVTAAIIGVCMSITAEATTAGVLLELGKIKSRVGAAIIEAGLFDDIFGFSLFIFITYLFKEVYLKEDLLMGAAILVFFVGLIVREKLMKNHHKFARNLRFYLDHTIIPFFFVSIGIHFEYGSLMVNPWLLGGVIVIAITGKLVGSLLLKPFTKFSWQQLHLIGWAMNSRGAIELALALIALRSGILGVELYSSIIIMALVTTIIFPIIVTAIIKKHRRVMD